MQKKQRLLLQVVEIMSLKGYAIKTQQIYLKWIKEYIFFHNKKHPLKMGKTEIDQFLTYLSKNGVTTHKRKKEAFLAILFLYTQVLEVSLQDEYIQASRTPGVIPAQKMVQSVMVF